MLITFFISTEEDNNYKTFLREEEDTVNWGESNLFVGNEKFGSIVWEKYLKDKISSPLKIYSLKKTKSSEENILKT